MLYTNSGRLFWPSSGSLQSRFGPRFLHIKTLFDVLQLGQLFGEISDLSKHCGKSGARRDAPAPCRTQSNHQYLSATAEFYTTIRM